LGLCHLFSRQATRKRDIFYTYRVPGSLWSSTLVLSQTSLNNRHDLYLITSFWVVATQVRASLTIFELSSVKSSCSESLLIFSKCIQIFSKKNEKRRNKYPPMCVCAYRNQYIYIYIYIYTPLKDEKVSPFEVLRGCRTEQKV
jgi:hypothetical protein